MSKKGNLVDALSDFDRRPAGAAKPVKANTAAELAEAPEGERAKAVQPPSRRGKRAFTGYFAPEVLKQLKMLAAAEDKTMQSLMVEAINELFKKYGKPHIA